MLLRRLAQIAQELENEGLDHEAAQLDDVLYNMPDQTQQPQQSPTQTMMPQQSVMDVLSEFLHSAVQNAQKSGLSPEQIMSGGGQAAVNMAASGIS